MSDGSVFDRAPAFVVHVKDAISPALAGHDGASYQSPPQPRDEALIADPDPARPQRGTDPPTSRALDLPDRGRPAHGHARRSRPTAPAASAGAEPTGSTPRRRAPAGRRARSSISTCLTEGGDV